MAVDYGGKDITAKSSADLSTKQYYAVTMETSGKIALANSAGEKCYGILQNKPDADDEPARVRINGTSKMIAGAAIEEGAELAATAAGKVVTAVAEDYIIGIAINPAAADGDQIAAMLVNYEKNA